MISFKTLEINVLSLIDKYFKDKTDKGGKPYIGHLYRVAVSVEKDMKSVLGLDYEPDSSLALHYKKAYIVVLLHDILEDTDCTKEELYSIGCDDEIVNAVIATTRKKEEEFYFDFIERVKKNTIARIVKIYDLEDNMDIKRLKSFGEYEMKRLKKYWYSWKYLKGEIDSVTCNNAIHPNRLFR